MLQKQFSLKFTTMFAFTILEDLKQPLSILSDDVEASDKLFDSVIYEYAFSFFLLVSFLINFIILGIL